VQTPCEISADFVHLNSRCLIGSAYQRESKLQEAIAATEKSIEIHAAGNNEDNFLLAREQFCLIMEDMDNLPDAKEIRLRGASTGSMVCSSPQVCWAKCNLKRCS
jgi:hypothetical protein